MHTDHIERFHATIERRPVDHSCTWLGLPDPAAHQGLFAHFGVSDVPGLIISPSHEAILPDTPPANVEALFNASRMRMD